MTVVKPIMNITHVLIETIFFKLYFSIMDPRPVSSFIHEMERFVSHDVMVSVRRITS